MKVILFSALIVALASASLAQVKTEVPPVIAGAKPFAIERVKIHGAALEGNLEGDAVDRDAIVFLPPTYATQKSRRYPVVYALHGYSIGAEQWSKEIYVPQTIEGAIALGAQEMIVVRKLKPGASILDIGCGYGVPISETLLREGFHVYGVDASESLVVEFRKRFPEVMVECNTVEDSAAAT